MTTLRSKMESMAARALVEQKMLTESESWEGQATKEKAVKAFEVVLKSMEDTYRTLTALYELLPEPLDSKLQHIRNEQLKLKQELKQVQSQLK